MESSLHDEMAASVADLTFRLLASCQKKEEHISRSFHLSVAEFRVIRTFRTTAQRPVKEILDELGVSSSSFSKIAAHLEASQLVFRTVDPHDRRAVLMALTTQGMELSRRLEHRYLEIHEQLLRGIPAELHASVIMALESLFRSLDAWLNETP